jgi:hypothetical protein
MSPRRTPAVLAAGRVRDVVCEHTSAKMLAKAKSTGHLVKYESMDITSNKGTLNTKLQKERA